MMHSILSDTQFTLSPFHSVSSPAQPPTLKTVLSVSESHQGSIYNIYRLGVYMCSACHAVPLHCSLYNEATKNVQGLKNVTQ